MTLYEGDVILTGIYL